MRNGIFRSVVEGMLITLVLAVTMGSMAYAQENPTIQLPFDRSVEGIRHLPALGPGATLSAEEAQGRGDEGFRDILATAGRFLTMTLGTIGIMYLFVAGVRLVTAQEKASEEMEQQKRTVLYVVLGLTIFALSAELVYNFIYRDEGSFLFDRDEAIQVATEASARIKGLLNLALSFSGAGAILMLVLTSLRLVVDPGNDDQIEQQKKVVGYTALGIIIIGLANTLINQVIFPDGGYNGVNVGAFELQLRGLSNYILGFMGVFIFASFIISGVSMMVYYGNDDVISRIKSTLINILIGTFVAFSSYTIIATILGTLIQ